MRFQPFASLGKALCPDGEIRDVYRYKHHTCVYINKKRVYGVIVDNKKPTIESKFYKFIFVPNEV